MLVESEKNRKMALKMLESNFRKKKKQDVIENGKLFPKVFVIKVNGEKSFMILEN